MKKEILCPVCLKANIKKKLLEVEDTAKGIIYPYCKCHKAAVKIDLNDYDSRKVTEEN